MAFTRSTVAVDNVRQLEDQPKNKATEVKTAMDQYGIDDKDFINNHMDELEATSAAANIGYSGDVPTSTTVKSALDYIYGQGSGSIPPDGSITRPKLADDVNAVILNNSKGIATNSAAIDELLVEAGISTKLAPTSGKFYDYVGASGQLSQGEIDLTKAYSETVTQGTNTISVTSMNVNDFSDFEIGQEVTLQDDTSKETLTILLLNDPLITFSTNIVNTYATGANVYRSNIKADGDVYKFGGFNAEEVIDRTTPVQVVGSAYTTSASGRPIRLDSGRLISVMVDTVPNPDVIYWEYSDDNGTTWNQLCFANNAYADGKPSMVTDGVNVHTLVLDGTSNIRPYVFNFNGDTQTNIDILSTRVFVSPTESSMGECSVTIAPNGDLHASWSSKNATYPNSFNIRYSKSTDGGVTWDAPTQVTTINTGINFLTPSIVFTNSNPYIVCRFDQASVENISILTTAFTTHDSYSGSMDASWGDSLIYSGGAYIQSNPSADVLSDGTIIVAWHGQDAVDNPQDNIRFSQSSDNGVTWSAMEKITSGSSFYKRYPSITRDENDKIYIMFGKNDAVIAYDLTLIEGNSGSWGVEQPLTNRSGSGNVRASTVNNYRSFTKPLTIFQGDNTENDVKFYGEWTEGTELDLLDVDIRMNITPLIDVSDIGAYMNISDNVLAVDGKVSIVDSTASESYTDLVDTRYPIDATNDEVASLLNSTVTAEDKVTLYYNLTRTLTTDVVELTSILGGVS